MGQVTESLAFITTHYFTPRQILTQISTEKQTNPEMTVAARQSTSKRKLEVGHFFLISSYQNRIATGQREDAFFSTDSVVFYFNQGTDFLVRERSRRGCTFQWYSAPVKFKGLMKFI